MKTILFLLSIVFITHHSLAQKKKEVVVKPGNSVAKSIPVKDRYRYEEFKDGFLITVGKKRSQALKMNFELLMKEPHFINEKGDTLFLDKNLAKYVQIGNTVYANTKEGYYELLSFNESLKLAIVREWSIARYETEYTNPLGKKEKNYARDTRTTIYSPKYGQIRNEDVVYERDSIYFFIDAKERAYKASKNNLLRMFPKQEEHIKDYIEQQKTDFKKEEDLLKLSAFCNNLLAK